jgi:hypothetical protein
MKTYPKARLNRSTRNNTNSWFRKGTVRLAPGSSWRRRAKARSGNTRKQADRARWGSSNSRIAPTIKIVAGGKLLIIAVPIVVALLPLQLVMPK